MAKFSDHQAAGHGYDRQEVQCIQSTLKKKETKHHQQQKTQTEIVLVHADSNSGLPLSSNNNSFPTILSQAMTKHFSIFIPNESRVHNII